MRARRVTLAEPWMGGAARHATQDTSWTSAAVGAPSCQLAPTISFGVVSDSDAYRCSSDRGNMIMGGKIGWPVA